MFSECLFYKNSCYNNVKTKNHFYKVLRILPWPYQHKLGTNTVAFLPGASARKKKKRFC